MLANWPSVVGLFVVSVPCIILNLVVMVGIVLDRSLHTITNIFIVSLAFSDLLVGAVVVPLYVAEQNSGPVEMLLDCVLTRSFTVFFILASVAHLLLIAVDRYIAITFPLRHQTLVTKRRAAGLVLTCWLLSIMAALAPLIGWRKAEALDLRQMLSGTCSYVDYMTLSYILVMIIVWYTVPVIAMVVMYGLIFRTASKQAKKIRDIHRSVEHLNEDPATNTRGRSGPSTADHGKAAKVLCTIMGCFFACTLPGLVCLFIDHATGSGVSVTVANCTNLLTFLNSALNPLLYGIGNRQVRSSITQRFCQWPSRVAKLKTVATGRVRCTTVTSARANQVKPLPVTKV